MTIRIESKIAYVSKETITFECGAPDYHTIVYNGTGVKGDLNEDGSTVWNFNKADGYWVIPFSDNGSFIANGGCTLSCRCVSCDGPVDGECGTRSSGNTTTCSQESCSGRCEGSMNCPGGGGYFIGGAVIIPVDQVIYE